MVALALVGCEDGGDPGVVVNDPDPVSVTQGEPGTPPPLAMAVDTLGLTREEPAGVAPGFNLDNFISPAGDSASCNHGDFTSPDGEPGIDNQAALLPPLLELAGLSAFEDLVQRSIEEGGLLIMLEMDGVDDLVNDPNVSLRMKIGSGTPLLGTDGLLLSGQTFSHNTDYPTTEMPNAKIVDGVLTAGPFDANLPAVVFGVQYNLGAEGSYLRANVTYDGGLTDGVLGGRVPMSDLWEIAEIADQEAGGLLEAISLILNGIADMGKDANGDCTHMSGSFRFTAVSAFFRDE